MSIVDSASHYGKISLNAEGAFSQDLVMLPLKTSSLLPLILAFVLSCSMDVLDDVAIDRLMMSES